MAINVFCVISFVCLIKAIRFKCFCICQKILMPANFTTRTGAYYLCKTCCLLIVSISILKTMSLWFVFKTWVWFLTLTCIDTVTVNKSSFHSIYCSSKAFFYPRAIQRNMYMYLLQAELITIMISLLSFLRKQYIFYNRDKMQQHRS